MVKREGSRKLICARVRLWVLALMLKCLVSNLLHPCYNIGVALYQICMARNDKLIYTAFERRISTLYTGIVEVLCQL